MSSGLPSDEVAEDYKNSLEDLVMNSRYEISNLTIIAKENTEHALAISRVLENHIKNAPPNRKLPALYVLDSVVKNVGTPYTLFLGRNLFSTFMNAYTLVDSQTRKKLDEMLKTWKEPVPGSMETRPVFPPEVTRQIENALIKARTAAVHVQQQQARSQQDLLGRKRAIGTPPVNYRNTPTPPQAASRYQPPPTLQNPPGMGNGYVQPQQYMSQYQSNATPQPYQHGNGYGQFPLDELNNDLERLISRASAELATNPYDSGVPTRFKALIDLKNILQSQQLPPEQIQAIRKQVSQLSAVADQPHIPAQPVQSIPFQPQQTPIQASAYTPPQLTQAPQQPASLQTLLNPQTLAELLKVTGTSQQPTPPPQSALTGQNLAALLGQRSITPQQTIQIPPPVVQTTAPPSAPAGGSLLDSLRAAGLLPPSASGTPVVPPVLPFPVPQPQPNTNTPPVVPATLARPVLAERKNGVEMTTNSLKIPRPHLIASLYEAQPNQCTTCGRRFLPTEEGKKRKARHLDWHFRVNQRMTEAAKRGQNRSWYLDEREWINSREVDEEAESPMNGSGGSAGANGADEAKKDPKKQYVPVPNDPSLANLSCPICQEKFETVWHDEAQEWVWMDSIKIGARIYHASCYAEASKDGGGTMASNLTPEPSVLGKRKAEEGDLNSLKSRIKTETVV